MRSRKARFYSQLIVGTALGGFGACQATAAPADVPASVSTISSADIVVTAQRRLEKLVDVPMSITRVDQQGLTNAGVTTFADLESIAVGVKIGNTGIFPEPSIRGITSFLTAGGADSNVATYVDGFYQPDPLLFAQDIVNLQDLQVLKGPQGTLYGRNASGGAILVRTLDPDMNKFTGKFNAGYGNFNDARGSGYVSVPLAPGLAMSFDGSYRRNDGFIKGVIVGKHNNKSFNVSPYKANQYETKVKWQATDNLTFTGGYHHTYLNDPYNNNYNIYALKGWILTPVLNQTDRRDHVVRNVQTLYNSKSDTVHGRLEWKTDAGTLSFASQYQSTVSNTYQDDDDTGLDYSRNGARFGQHSWDHTLEFQTSAIDRLNLVMGINRFVEHAFGAGFSYSGVDPATGIVRATPTVSGSKSKLNTRAMAYYIDGTWNPIDKLFLTAGVRYTSERKWTTSHLYNGTDLFDLASRFPLSPANFNVGDPAHLNGGYIHHHTFHSVTPRAVIRYEFAHDANVYFSYSQGFKSGTYNTSVNPLSPVLDATKPEKSTNYELGFKIARPRFRVEGAVFYTDFKDLQTSTVVCSPPGCRLTTIVINAKGAENYGGELSAAWTPVDDLNIHAGVGYTHARYKKFPNAVVNIPDLRPKLNNTTTCVAPAAPCVVNPNYQIGILTSQVQDFTGLQIERAPDWTANVGIDYTAHIGSGRLVLAANANYVSSYAPRTDAHDPVTRKRLYVQKGYAQVNAQATYNFAGEHISVGVWVKNLTNKRFKTTWNPGSNGIYNLYSSPRTFGFNVGYKF
jgi:iron complex outermembrane receptor protein